MYKRSLADGSLILTYPSSGSIDYEVTALACYATPTLKGVHWFNASNTDMPNSGQWSKRLGWNVETVIGLNDGTGAYNTVAVTDAHGRCVAAASYGLVNIVRLDWMNGVAVPTGDPTTWKNSFSTAVNTLKDVASLFIVGNEPNIEGPISAAQYAAAFNSLYPGRVAGTRYLAAGPAAFSFAGGLDDLGWLAAVADSVSGIAALDGWALHTYSTPGPCDYGFFSACSDPETDCLNAAKCLGTGDIAGDRSFRRYRNFIVAIRGARSDNKPVYITETNTFGFGAPTNRPMTAPINSYPSLAGTTYMNRAYEDVRLFNSDPSNAVKVCCLCWFVDQDLGTWSDFALSTTGTGAEKLVQARSDLIAADASVFLQ